MAAGSMLPVLQSANYVLPPSIVSRVDLSRLVSELEWVDNEMTSLAIRNPTGSSPLPAVSKGLSDMIRLNGLDITDRKTRASAVAQLRVLKNKAPVLHMTFAVSADRTSLEQLTEWVRREIHPHAVLTIGLQPGLVAGVYLRTPNHVKDMSLRAVLDGRHDLLIKELEGLRRAK